MFWAIFGALWWVLMHVVLPLIRLSLYALYILLYFVFDEVVLLCVLLLLLAIVGVFVVL